jgi:HlyD family secretion protein
MLTAVYAYGRNAKLEVDRASVAIGQVTHGEFQEYIAVFGTAKPKRIVSLDSAEGGRVKQVHARAGERVKSGDRVLDLTNSAIEMDIMQRQASMNEQQTSLNGQQLEIERQRAELMVNLVQSRHRVETLTARAQRAGQLAATRTISVEEVERIEADLRESRELTRLYEQQLKDVTSSGARMLRDIEQTRARLRQSKDALQEILDALKVVAPIDGVLDIEQLDVGQLVAKDQKLGRVYSPDAFDIEVRADEIHASRISEGQLAMTTLDGVIYKLEIAKVYPTVQGGTFPLDMRFVEAAPARLKPGQRIEIRLELGKQEKVVRVPVGPFYNDTGGRWIYVIDAERRLGRKVAISLGRKNPDYYEVVHGLSAGMSVITSGYSAFGGATEITLLSGGAPQ